MTTIAAPTGRPPRASRAATVASRALLIAANAAAVAALLAPMIAGADPAAGREAAHATDGPILLALAVPALLAVALGEASGKRLDAKGIALLGVL
ncbi:MAG TPA: ECF transporter S component, partial [Actinomycetota bacterium]|nr:ECF transporter S component [Actinomycetota bacterium]